MNERAVSVLVLIAGVAGWITSLISCGFPDWNIQSTANVTCHFGLWQLCINGACDWYHTVQEEDFVDDVFLNAARVFSTVAVMTAFGGIYAEMTLRVSRLPSVRSPSKTVLGFLLAALLASVIMVSTGVHFLLSGADRHGIAFYTGTVSVGFYASGVAISAYRLKKLRPTSQPVPQKDPDALI